MARPELPRELSKAATGEEDDVLKFVHRYGLLGYRQAWRREEQAGVVAQYPQSEQAEQPKAPGDPFGWFVAHAQTVKLVLGLIGALDESDTEVRKQFESRPEFEVGKSLISYRYARRGYLDRWKSRVMSNEPRFIALSIVRNVLDANLSGISRCLKVEGRDEKSEILTHLFQPRNLADAVYWHLADAAVGGWVRRCADPKCGAFFVAKNVRVKYCPPPKGYEEVSLCMNRAKQQRLRDKRKNRRG